MARLVDNFTGEEIDVGDMDEGSARAWVTSMSQYRAGVDPNKVSPLGIAQMLATPMLSQASTPAPRETYSHGGAVVGLGLKGATALISEQRQRNESAAVLAQRDRERREMAAQRERESVAQATEREKDRAAQLQYQKMTLDNQEKERALRERLAKENADARAAEAERGREWRDQDADRRQEFAMERIREQNAARAGRGGGGGGSSVQLGRGAISIDGETYYPRWNGTNQEYDYISESGKTISQTQLREMQQGGGDPEMAKAIAAQAADRARFNKINDTRLARNDRPMTLEEFSAQNPDPVAALQNSRRAQAAMAEIILAPKIGPASAEELNALYQQKLPSGGTAPVAGTAPVDPGAPAAQFPYLGKRMFVGKFKSMSPEEQSKFAQGGGTVTNNPDLVNIVSLSELPAGAAPVSAQPPMPGLVAVTVTNPETGEKKRAWEDPTTGDLFE